MSDDNIEAYGAAALMESIPLVWITGFILIHWLINNENRWLQPYHTKKLHILKKCLKPKTMKLTCFFFHADTNVNKFTLKGFRQYKNH